MGQRRAAVPISDGLRGSAISPIDDHSGVVCRYCCQFKSEGAGVCSNTANALKPVGCAGCGRQCGDALCAKKYRALRRQLHRDGVEGSAQQREYEPTVERHVVFYTGWKPQLLRHTDCTEGNYLRAFVHMPRHGGLVHLGLVTSGRFSNTMPGPSVGWGRRQLTGQCGSANAGLEANAVSVKV